MAYDDRSRTRRVGGRSRIVGWIAVIVFASGLTLSSTTPVTADFTGLDQPARLFDSREAGETIDGRQQAGGRRSPSSITIVDVADRAGIPVDAGVAVLNVTAVNPTARGFLTVFTCGPSAPPTASTLNYEAGITIANGATVAISDAGTICVFSSADTHLIVDITGYESAATDFGVLEQPGRLFDSRSTAETVDGDQAGDGIRSARSITEVRVTGRGGVPDEVLAVVLNITAVRPTTGGFLAVFACGPTTPPTASTLNFSRGSNIANTTTVAVSAEGTICVYTSADTHLVVDVNGFRPTGSTFGVLASPGRLLDSRPTGTTVDGEQAGGGVLEAASITEVDVAGRAGVPADATAVVLNVTAVRPVANGFLTVFGCDRSVPPTASTVNYSAGSTIAGGTTSVVGSSGKICVFSSKKTDLIVDVIAFVKPELVPLTSSAGARPGLAGCLNRPLYTGGEHTVVRNVDREQYVSVGGSSFSSPVYTEIYRHRSGSPDKSIAGISLPGLSGARVVALEGNELIDVGSDTSMLGFVMDPEPRRLDFDLKVGESRRIDSVVWLGGTDEAGNPTFVSLPYEVTYVGREKVTVDGEVFDACRVERNGIFDLPFVSDGTIWYAVGSGIELKSVAVNIDPFDTRSPDGLTVATTTQLTSATINGVPIRP